MDLQLYRFDIAKALTLWTSDFQLTAERKHIKLHLDVDGFKGHEEIVADKEKIARIVFNLLSNALKYTPAGGDIFVSLKTADEDFLRIDVRDTGKGISNEEAEKVFERFFQAKGAASGTGIGLALVKSFVELHHGKAWVESEPDKGSDFIVVIPCKQMADSIVIHNDDETVDNSESSSLSAGKEMINESDLQYIDDGNKQSGKLQKLLDEQGNKPSLLVIDDNNDIRQYLRTLLQDEFYVFEASDGREGLEVALKEVPDLVICDVMMPVMNGLEFTEQLKTQTITSHIPVIMLTAKNLDEHRAEGYEHGADSYITKPFHSKVLLSRIENLLKQRRLLKTHFENIFNQTSQTAELEVAMNQLEDRDKQFLNQLHAIIQKNLSDSEFGVEDIGKGIGLSRVQLYRKVKAMTGSSVVDLLRKARLAKAKRLLESRSMSVSEVAYEVGFSAPSYFTKCFKEEYGMLPGEVGNN